MNTIQEVNLNVNSIKIITNPQYGSLHMIMFDGDLNK